MGQRYSDDASGGESAKDKKCSRRARDARPLVRHPRDVCTAHHTQVWRTTDDVTVDYVEGSSMEWHDMVWRDDKTRRDGAGRERGYRPFNVPFVNLGDGCQINPGFVILFVIIKASASRKSARTATGRVERRASSLGEWHHASRQADVFIVAEAVTG